jgi:crotonobetainyl-CoA:carnitine CoA-transferase CaiB-like acyl-CoA transferase
MLRMPGFGLSGPYKNYRALGTHIEGMIGHHYIRSYPDATPEQAGDVYTGDAVAGIQGALAVSMALRHRQRTGEGQQIELAQAENFLPVLGEQILEWTMNRHDPGPQGNRHRGHAPHNAYPTRGLDQWIAIDAASDEEFAALCGVLGAPELASDARFAANEQRQAHEGDLDRVLGELTRKYDKWWLFHRLQAARVSAGPLQTAAEKFACPQLQARGFFEYLDHPYAGRHWYPGLTWKMALTPNRLRRHAVTIGQDNEYVYREVMGLDADEYARHVESGQIGDTYTEALLGYTPGVD